MLVMLASCNAQPPARPDLKVTVVETPYFLGTKQTEVTATWTESGTIRTLIARKYGKISPKADLTEVSFVVYVSCRETPGAKRTCVVSTDDAEFIEAIREAQQRELVKFKKR
jgi:hypothetical protein